MDIKDKQILQAIFDEDEVILDWKDVENFLKNIGANFSSNDTRIRIKLNQFKAVLHKPLHQDIITPKDCISLRKLLTLNARGKL